MGLAGGRRVAGQPDISIAYRYNKSAPWSIPKGIPDAGESMEEAARRETLEETGVAVEGPLGSLGFVVYRRGKRVHGFCAPAPVSAEPRCASWEVDRAQFFPLNDARLILHAAQKEFVERLDEYLGRTPESGSAPPLRAACPPLE